MIARKNRFWGKKDIERVYRNSKTSRAETLTLKYSPPKHGSYRLAVVVSKKVNKSAVVRNRIRRRLYEQFRIMHKNGNLPAKDMVLSVYDDKIAKLPHAELSVVCEGLVRKIDK